MCFLLNLRYSCEILDESAFPVLFDHSGQAAELQLTSPDHIRHVDGVSAQLSRHLRARPVFRITASDDIAHPICAHSPAAAWRELLSRLPADRYRSLIGRRRVDDSADTDSADTYSYGLSGVAFFGLHHARVARLMEMLPNAPRCLQYRFAFSDDDERSCTEDPVADRIAAAAKATALAAAEAKRISRPLPVNRSGCARCEPYIRKRLEDKAPFISSVHCLADIGGTVTVVEKSIKSQSVEIEHDSEDSNAVKTLTMQYKRMKTLPLRVRVGRSPIHNWGLFARETIQAGEVPSSDIFVHY
jgi:hypothetical protein